MYSGGKLTAEDIRRLNPERDAEMALAEIQAVSL